MEELIMEELGIEVLGEWEEIHNGRYYNWEDDKQCRHCEHRFECEELEMFWGCPVYEDSMGADL